MIANFNPNSRINDYNPNKTQFLHVDKSQLIVNTTEFCFHPTGFFEISSRGEVKNESGDMIAVSQINTLTNPGFEIFRITQQSEFMEGYNPLDNTGNQSSAYLTEAVGVATTAGLEFDNRIEQIQNFEYPGHRMQSYPEPEVIGKNYIEGSVYDGYLMLSTIQPKRDEFFNDSANNLSLIHI